MTDPAPIRDPQALAALARRYVDLWQDQFAAMAADPELAQAYLRLLGKLTASPVAARPSRDAPAAASGAAPAAAAPDGGVERVAQLEARLADLEERLARLEGRPR